MKKMMFIISLLVVVFSSCSSSSDSSLNSSQSLKHGENVKEQVGVVFRSKLVKGQSSMDLYLLLENGESIYVDYGFYWSEGLKPQTFLEKGDTIIYSSCNGLGEIHSIKWMR